MDCGIFQQTEIETQYSIIPTFHYSSHASTGMSDLPATLSPWPPRSAWQAGWLARRAGAN
jgi:hypothetical protein